MFLIVTLCYCVKYLKLLIDIIDVNRSFAFQFKNTFSFVKESKIDFEKNRNFTRLGGKERWNISNPIFN